MPNFDNLPTAEAIPEAVSMLETFRAIGYSLESAIADIIDNSITAEGGSVWIDFEWKGQNSWISIRDNGYGMNNDGIIKAMTPGCKNPLDPRSINDLGRFGLGLKTASFSQCRQLTVISNEKKAKPNYWTWDLDYVKDKKKWLLLSYLPNEPYYLKQLENSNSGSIVIWNKLDRLIENASEDDEDAFKHFLATMERVKKHLSMVFHRFIADGELKIFFRGRALTAWDPFLEKLESTQKLAVERFHSGKVTMRGYVLPHKLKLTDEQYKDAEGLNGWGGQQGFYVYRNKRLLLYGDWLGMFRKEDHYKLCRISIDLPNHLDKEWQIDIMKSIARPPSYLKEQIRAYALKVRGRAVEVFRHRGKTIQPKIEQEFVPLWIDHKRDNKWFYKINRNHPVIKRAYGSSKEMNKSIETIFRFIEETIPVKSIYIKESEESGNQGQPFEGLKHEEIKKIMKEMYKDFKLEGFSKDEAMGFILNTEPFNMFPHYLTSNEE